MLKNIPTDFQLAINSASRKPIQLLHFKLPDKTFYLSDNFIGKGQGLAYDYEPWVEDWGTIKDNTNINSIFEGNSLEIRSCKISLIVSNSSRTFIKEIFAAGIENSEVELYQWFGDIDSEPRLIDTFLCQDPIKQTEKSMLLEIDLVSVLMKSDPYLFPAVEGYEEQPVIIGKATGLPLKDLQTSRKTAIAQDFTFDYTGSVFIDNGVGFPASGVVSIDSEDVSYDWITASAIHITARGLNNTVARPHYRGALVLPYGAIYDYVICSGPVDSVSNLKANGEAYVNDVTFFTNQHPVIARFVGRPPWLKVEAGANGDPIIPDPLTVLMFGSGAERLSYWVDYPDGISLINSDAGACTMAMSYTNGGGDVLLENVTSFLTDSYNVTASYYDNLKLHGIESYSAPTLETVTLSGYITADGVSGHIDHICGKALSDINPLVSVIAKITIVNAYTVFADSKIEIIFVDVNGTETVIDSDQLNEYDGNSFGAYFKFNAKTFEYDVTSKVSNPSDLQYCRLRVKFTNIRINTARVASYNISRVVWNQTKWDITYFQEPTTAIQPWQIAVSSFGKDLSSWGTLTNVKVRLNFALSVTDAIVEFEIQKYPGSLQSYLSYKEALFSTTFTGDQTGKEYTYDLGAISWAELQNLRIGIMHKLVGINEAGLTNTSIVTFSYVKWEITYQPDDVETPDEQRVVYAETISCDVTSKMGANITPANAIVNLLQNHSDVDNLIDTVDFAKAHTNYENAGYYLNGALDAGITLHSALRQILREGMCRFLFNEGKIKLLTYFEEQETTIDMDVSLDDIQFKSRTTDNQPTSVIKNDITVFYNKDYTKNVYNGKVRKEDEQSIVSFFRKEHKRELSLINSEAIADIHVDRLLSLMSKPNSIYSFNMFMRGYILEKGDRITARQFLDPRFKITGNVLSIDRVFGKGKTQQMNLFKVSISNPVVNIELNLTEEIEIDDTSLSLIKGLILKDTIEIDDTSFIYEKEFKPANEKLRIVDTLYMNKCAIDSGYGVCGYGVFPYGR